MRTLRSILYIPAAMLVTMLQALHLNTAMAQDYPTRAIRMISNSPGGGGDIVARLIAQQLSQALGQQIVVDPHGGSGGLIAGEMLAKAQPDGYTLLLYSNALWLGPLLRERQTYDVLKDFAPIAMVAYSPNILVVHPSLPVKSVKDLIALARAKPGALNYGISGLGSAVHIAGELFASMAGVDIVRVNYKGVVAAINDLVSGNVQLTFGSAGAVAPHVASHRIRALAVTSAEPSALAPDLPTVAASGLPGYESVSRHGVFAPIKTSPVLIKRLNQEIVRILDQQDVKQRFLSTGVETAPSTPEQFTAAIKTEITTFGKIIKDAGIKVE